MATVEAAEVCLSVGRGGWCACCMQDRGVGPAKGVQSADDRCDRTQGRDDTLGNTCPRPTRVMCARNVAHQRNKAAFA